MFVFEEKSILMSIKSQKWVLPFEICRGVNSHILELKSFWRNLFLTDLKNKVDFKQVLRIIWKTEQFSIAQYIAFKNRYSTCTSLS